MTESAENEGRVLLLGELWPDERPGGLNRYLAALLNALHGAGSDVRAIVVGPVPAGLPRTVGAGDRGGPLPLRLWHFARAARHAGADGVAVVDAHFPMYCWWPVVVGSLRRLPLVVHFQGPWADESVAAGQRSRWRIRCKRLVEASLYGRANTVIVLSRAFRRVVVERYGVPPWRVEVVPPGVDLERFRPGDRRTARRLLGIPVEAPVVLAVRRLVPRMGIDVLLEAWARRGDEGGVLIVAGEGPQRRNLEAHARQLGLDSTVRFLGRVGEDVLVACYQAADLAVVPTVALEGFGLVVLEALACGTPVLATDAAGLPEAVASLDPGLIVPAGDPNALAARIEDLLSSAHRAPDAERCRRYAEMFSWQGVASRHQDLYRRARRSERHRLRVVYLDHCAQLSGAELAMLRLLPALGEAVDSHVILGEDGPLVGRLQAAGISTEVLPMAEVVRGLARHRVQPGRLPVASVAHAVRYVAVLARRLRRLRPDLVHTNSLKAGVYGSIAAALAGVPVVWHARERLAEDYVPLPAIRMVRAMVRRVPTAVIANSASTREGLAAPGVKTVVIPSPVHIEVLPRSRPAGSPLRVGMVGRLAPSKGQQVFIDAFAKAFPEGPTQAVIIGAPLFGEAAYERKLREQIAGLGLSGRVELTGFREDVAAELAGLDVLVHASVITEGFGQVVVEGMAAGLAVVAADAGGPAEVITDGHDGLLYPTGNAEFLAAALQRLAADPMLRDRLGEAARRRARDFAPNVVADSVLALYREVVRGRRPGSRAPLKAAAARRRRTHPIRPDGSRRSDQASRNG